MPVALLCSRGSLEPELKGTVLWRTDVDRRFARTPEDVRRITREVRPDIAVVDGALAGVKDVVSGLRRYPRQVSIVVVVRDEEGLEQGELMAAGANAILQPPPGPAWDERLAKLWAVPPRKHARVPVYFERDDHDGVQVGLGTILDVSVRGALLETDHPLQLGDVLDLRFRLPAPGGPVQGCGRVLRMHASRRFGIEFYGLEGSGAEEVARFVADHRTEMLDSSAAPPEAGRRDSST